MIAWILFSAWSLASIPSLGLTDDLEIGIGMLSVFIIGAVIYFVFACLKIHGIRVENNKLIGIYLGFRYCLFALYMIGSFILIKVIDIFILIVGGVYLILDIGLIVILHSIRVDRENSAGTEN